MGGGANVNYSRPTSGVTSLVFATYYSTCCCIVPTLLQHGANPNPAICISAGYQSPLVNAYKHRDSSEVVQQLLDLGADLKDSEDAINTAVKHCNEAAIRVLMTHMALKLDPNHITAITSSSLWYSVRQGDINADIFGVVLDCYRETMTADDLQKLLLSPFCDDACDTLLHHTNSAQVAKLLIEQPRRENNKLLTVCQQQLVRKGDDGQRPLDKAHRIVHTGVAAYLETFECLIVHVRWFLSSMPPCWLGVRT